VRKHETGGENSWTICIKRVKVKHTGHREIEVVTVKYMYTRKCNISHNNKSKVQYLSRKVDNHSSVFLTEHHAMKDYWGGWR